MSIYFCERRTRDQIEAERAPQILKIDHDDAISLSGDDESLDSDSDDELSSGYHSNRSRQLQSGKNLLDFCYVSQNYVDLLVKNDFVHKLNTTRSRSKISQMGREVNGPDGRKWAWLVILSKYL